MNWFQKPATKVIIRSQVELTEKQITAALAAHVEGVPAVEAVLQLIDEIERSARSAAISSVASHGAVASEVGALQVLDELRIAILARREQGRTE